MKPALFEYRRCADTAQALAWLAAGDGMAKIGAGTQSLGPMLNLRLAQPGELLDISRIDVLRGFSLQDGVLRIGAAVTHARIEDGVLPDVTRGLLPAVAAGIAYRAVRNRGTLGGSLAHADPAADWVTTVCLLGAVVVVLRPEGERRVDARDFFESPFTTALHADELLVAIEVPQASAEARWAYRKACRKPGEFAEAIAALWVDPTLGVARAVLGALDGMPHIVDGIEAVDALRHADGVDHVLDAIGLDDPYRRQLHRSMIRRAFADLDSFP